MLCVRKENGCLFEAIPAKKTELLAEAMSRKLELLPNLSQQDETGEVNSEYDKESAETLFLYLLLG